MLLNHRDDVSPKLPVTVYGSIVGWGRPSLVTMFGLWVNPSLCLLRGRPACFVARSEGSRSDRAFFVVVVGVSFECRVERWQLQAPRRS